MSKRAAIGAIGAVFFFAIAAPAANSANSANNKTSSSSSGSSKSDPDRCPDAFSCGALSAHLAGKNIDYPGAFRAIERACRMDELFCEQHATLFISAGPDRGGNPAKGFAMLEALCKKIPNTPDARFHPCSTLAREYQHPPKSSGVAPQLRKAEKLLDSNCSAGDWLDCSALGDLYLKGGTDVPADMVKARASYDRGCSGGTDHYSFGVCSTLGDKLHKGVFGEDKKAEALPYLEKSCSRGYRCDLAFEIHTQKNDTAAAKRIARKQCEQAIFDCDLIAKFETKDRTWAKEQYRQVCQDRGTKVACQSYERLGGVVKPKASAGSTPGGSDTIL